MYALSLKFIIFMISLSYQHYFTYKIIVSKFVEFYTKSLKMRVCFYVKQAEFCVNQAKFSVKQVQLCVKKQVELCVKQVQFCVNQVQFCIKQVELCVKQVEFSAKNSPKICIKFHKNIEINFFATQIFLIVPSSSFGF